MEKTDRVPNLKIIAAGFLGLISWHVLLGAITGYLIGKFYCEKMHGRYLGPIKIKSIILNVGNYHLHLHHWLLCSGILFFIFPKISLLSAGVLSGLIFQDIDCDENWYKVISKNKNPKEIKNSYHSPTQPPFRGNNI